MMATTTCHYAREKRLNGVTSEICHYYVIISCSLHACRHIFYYAIVVTLSPCLLPLYQFATPLFFLFRLNIVAVIHTRHANTPRHFVHNIACYIFLLAATYC